MSGLTVATHCTNCGAPLEFTEGVNALQCSHCKTNLLVTGRKQILSYFISPKLPIQRAVALASLAVKNTGVEYRVVDPKLYFLPYYRFTGQEFRWENAPPSAKSDSADSPPVLEPRGRGRRDIDKWNLAFLAVAGFQYLLRSHFVATAIAAIAAGALALYRRMNHAETETPVPPIMDPRRIGKTLPDRPGSFGEYLFADRHIERNFIACDLEGFGVFSLGFRAAVLKLELFRKEALPADSRVATVKMTPDQAQDQAIKQAEPEKVLYRTILGRILSIVYFPFWMVEVESAGRRRIVIVDAVAETVVHRDAPVEILTKLSGSPPANPPIAGFRPLTCPNCGWDLPLRSDDVLFFCAHCRKAWLLSGSELSMLPYAVAGKNGNGQPQASDYLPFWEVRVEGDEAPYFIPAFRLNRLKFLYDLARALSSAQPAYSPMTGALPPLHGGYYDRDDALKLAAFVRTGMKAKSSKHLAGITEKPLVVASAELRWLPFQTQGPSLVSPYTHTAIPRAVLSSSPVTPP